MASASISTCTGKDAPCGIRKERWYHGLFSPGRVVYTAVACPNGRRERFVGSAGMRIVAVRCDIKISNRGYGAVLRFQVQWSCQKLRRVLVEDHALGLI